MLYNGLNGKARIPITLSHIFGFLALEKKIILNNFANYCTDNHLGHVTQGHSFSLCKKATFEIWF